MPRAWLVRDVITVAPGHFDAANLSAVFDEAELDPRQRAVVESAGPLDFAGAVAADEQAQMTALDSSHLRVDVQADAPALLLLSEVWYPGWHAVVNGAETPIYRANGALRALAVPAGASTVELWFAPPSWRTGLWFALAGLILTALLRDRDRIAEEKRARDSQLEDDGDEEGRHRWLH